MTPFLRTHSMALAIQSVDSRLLIEFTSFSMTLEFETCESIAPLPRQPYPCGRWRGLILCSSTRSYNPLFNLHSFWNQRLSVSQSQRLYDLSHSLDCRAL